MAEPALLSWRAPRVSCERRTAGFLAVDRPKKLAAGDDACALIILSMTSPASWVVQTPPQRFRRDLVSEYLRASM
jgi:hypothetical protein